MTEFEINVNVLRELSTKYFHATQVTEKRIVCPLCLKDWKWCHCDVSGPLIFETAIRDIDSSKRNFSLKG
jgi:hypothetical protein